VSVAVRVGAGRAGDTAFVEVSGDAGDAVSSEPLLEYPGDVWRGAWVGSQALQPSAPAGVGGVGVGAGVDELVAVGWSSAEVAALLGGLVVHRRQHPVAGAEHFALRLGSECQLRSNPDPAVPGEP
jgi:hypothetical protein